jgi:hypothetical protein
MARHYIEFRIWLAPTVDTGLVKAVAKEIKNELNDLVRDAPVTIKDITYVIKREGERRPQLDPLSIPDGTTIH